MKRTAAILSTLPMMFLIAQGCSSSEGTAVDPGNTDDGGNNGNTDDGGGSNPIPGTDGGKGGSKDGGGGDGGAIVQTTPGTSLVTGKGITLYGVTSDGYVVYGKDTGKADDAGTPLSSLEVVPVAGGAPTVLAAVLNSTDDFGIAGKTIAYYQNVDQQGVAAQLSVWTAANGLKKIASATNVLDGLFDASTDGTHVVFAQNTDVAKLTSDFVVDTADGVTSTPLVTGFSLKTCSPDAGFRKAIVYATACTGAATTAAIATLDTGTANAVVTKTAGTAAKPGFASMDTNGTHLLYIKNANTVGTVATFDGKTPIAHAQNTAFAALNTDGTKLVYRTNLPDGGAGSLESSPAGANTPTALIPVGVSTVLGIADDFSNGVVALKGADKTTNPKLTRYDLNFASLATAGAPKVLTPAGLPVGFNTASSFFFYLQDLPTTGQVPIATLKAHAAAGGVDKEIAKLVIEPKTVDGTTKVVFMENLQSDANMNPYIDLTVGDGAGAGAPTVVVQGADIGYQLSGTKLIYTNAAKGLYVVSVP
jgi:hypothetical protein